MCGFVFLSLYCVVAATECDNNDGGIDHLAALAVMGCEDLVDLAGALCVVDTRDSDYAKETNGVSPIPMLPEGTVVVRMPYQTIRGHVDYCRQVQTLQHEMRPPPALIPWVGKDVHMTICGDSKQRALDVARTLILSHVRCVSILDPQLANGVNETNPNDKPEEGK